MILGEKKTFETKSARQFSRFVPSFNPVCLSVMTALPYGSEPSSRLCFVKERSCENCNFLETLATKFRVGRVNESRLPVSRIAKCISRDEANIREDMKRKQQQEQKTEADTCSWRKIRPRVARSEKREKLRVSAEGNQCNVSPVLACVRDVLIEFIIN